jgi:hypothetical protein
MDDELAILEEFRLEELGEYDEVGEAIISAQ